MFGTSRPAWGPRKLLISVMCGALAAGGGLAFSQAYAAVPTETRLVLLPGANHAGGSPLDGATVSGDIYVVARPPALIDTVQFYLDGTLRSTEVLPPFDFATTAPDFTARPFDTTTIANGRHTITATVTEKTNAVEHLRATFTVHNGGTTTSTSTTSTTTHPTTSTTISSGGSLAGSNLAVSNSGIDGAGFQNVVAISPFLDANGNRPIIVGADTSAGFHRSVDNGQTWMRANNGLSNSTNQHVASLVFSPTTAGTVYAIAGAGGRGSFLVSTDFGLHWTVKASGFHADAGNSHVHPRPTGSLIVESTVSGTKTLFIGTLGEGVMRSTDGGNTFHSVAVAGINPQPEVRSLVATSDPNVLYAGTLSAGVYRINGATTTPQTTRLTGGPSTGEELAVIGTDLFVAARDQGVWAWSVSAQSWRSLNGPLTADGLFESVAGYVSGGNTTVFVGRDNASNESGVLKSTDGGATWVAATSDSSLSYNIVGTSQQWWLSQSAPSMMPSKGSYTAAQIVIDPSTHANVFVAGRSGVWRSVDGGSSWAPAVKGLGVTVNSEVVTDPNNQSRAFVANTDWVVISSGDGLSSVHAQHPSGSGTTGYAIAFDTTTHPSTVFLGSGNRDTNTDGDVFVSADPLTGSFTSLNLKAVTGGKRPLGLAVSNRNGHRVVLAAVEGAGIYKKVDSGAWQAVSAVGLADHAISPKFVSMAFVTGTDIVYAYDSGNLWRSNDAGSTWLEIYAGSAGQRQGFALDKFVSGRIYLSTATGLIRLDNAQSATSAAGVSHVDLGVARSRTIGVDGSGALWVTSAASATETAKLFVSTNVTSGGSTFVDKTTPAYAAVDGDPSSIAFVGGSAILISTADGGVLRVTAH